MDNVKHNGHFNFATWQFNLNITNSENNVNYLRNNREDLLKMNDSELLNDLVKSLEFWDKPERENIYIPEVRETIKEV